MIHSTFLRSALALIVGSTLAGTLSTGFAFDMGNMMDPSQWMGGGGDRDDYDDGPWGGPGYGYGGPGGFGGPAYGYGGPETYGVPGYGYSGPGAYGSPGYGYGGPGPYGSPGYGYSGPLGCTAARPVTTHLQPLQADRPRSTPFENGCVFSKAEEFSEANDSGTALGELDYSPFARRET